MLRAAPKNLLGICSAAGSRPPDNVRPLACTVRLYALASLVILSRSIITSCFCSTSLFALSIVISETLLCLSGSSSNVEYITSTLSPTIDSLISVTSSGRSSIRSIIRCISGLFLVTALAICLRSVVFPDLGCDTIIPRCPLPIGDIRSTILIAIVLEFFSRWILSLGNIGVRVSKALLLCATIGLRPLTVSKKLIAENFSLCVLGLLGPLMISPVFKLNFLISEGATYTSLSPGRKFSHLINPYPSWSTSNIPSAISGTFSCISAVSVLSCCLFSCCRLSYDTFSSLTISAACAFLSYDELLFTSFLTVFSSSCLLCVCSSSLLAARIASISSLFLMADIFFIFLSFANSFNTLTESVSNFSLIQNLLNTNTLRITLCFCI